MHIFATQRGQDHVENQRGDCFLERIPKDIYDELTHTLAQRYRLRNGRQQGGSLNFADYFLGIRRSVAHELMSFVQKIIDQSQTQELPHANIPDGFAAVTDALGPLERNGGFSFGCFDAALTKDGLKVIEVQGLPTYHVTAAFVSDFLRSRLSLRNAAVFVNQPDADWQEFITHLETVLAGDRSNGIVLMDRNLTFQKTNFEFYATQYELDLPVDLVDSRLIFEQEGRLYYRSYPDSEQVKPLHRLYNRVLALEAIQEDGYPSDVWKFRYDQAYEEMTFVNHPVRSLEVSKHLLPALTDSVNPTCYELHNLAGLFASGDIPYEDFVWKHKWGAAGRNLFLSPDQTILADLIRTDTTQDYIAQEKIEYERFHTGDGQEKIVELRFMTVQSEDKFLVVPMARLGHVQVTNEGEAIYRIHFGDNNRPGYGFCPTLIFDD